MAQSIITLLLLALSLLSVVSSLSSHEEAALERVTSKTESPSSSIPAEIQESQRPPVTKPAWSSQRAPSLSPSDKAKRKRKKEKKKKPHNNSNNRINVNNRFVNDKFLKMSNNHTIPTKGPLTSLQKLNKKNKHKKGGKKKPNLKDRTTLIADLTPYGQHVYLEYDSDDYFHAVMDKEHSSGTVGTTSVEFDDKKKVNGTRPTKMKTNGTSSSSSSASSALSIQFYPKTPVNLLNLLQLVAANAQQVQVQDNKTKQQTGGPVTMATSMENRDNSTTTTGPPPMKYNVTNRVPITINPPTSPFLFSLDLDSFFSRMAISFFYSTVAIAPLVYLMIGGLGSSLGMSMVPLTATGKKKRRRRRRRSLLLTSPNEEEDERRRDRWLYELNSVR